MTPADFMGAVAASAAVGYGVGMAFVVVVTLLQKRDS